MQAVVLTIHLLLALALILVVLLQRSEGGGLGMGGGSGLMTSRGAATALSKVTWALGAAFVVTSLMLTILAARDAGGGSVIDRLGPTLPASTAPVTPAPGLEGDLLPESTPASPPAADEATPAATPPASAPAAPAPALAPVTPSAEGPATPPPAQ
jgi:preprotein translocase subunit SecG